MEFIKNYWPLILLSTWFTYKWWNSQRVKKLLPQLKSKGGIFIDVRSEGEYSAGHAPGTINIPLQSLGKRLHEIPKTSPVVLCCASGTRSGMARMLLKKNGYKDVYNIGTWTKFLNAERL